MKEQVRGGGVQVAYPPKRAKKVNKEVKKLADSSQHV
jgi:hypothetical protein